MTTAVTRDVRTVSAHTSAAVQRASSSTSTSTSAWTRMSARDTRTPVGTTSVSILSEASLAAVRGKTLNVEDN